jgi:hypothetical protein
MGTWLCHSAFCISPTPWFVSHETLFYYIYFVNTQIRKSYTELNKIYFWITTIHNWLPLLEPEGTDMANTLSQATKPASTLLLYSSTERGSGYTGASMGNERPTMAESNNVHFTQTAVVTN